MTGHSKNYEELEGRMTNLIIDLHHSDLDVWRYKIEDTIIDSRTCDVLKLLNNGV